MATTKEIMAMSLDDLIADAVARKDKDALLWLQKKRNKKHTRKKDGKEVPHSLTIMKFDYAKKYLGSLMYFLDFLQFLSLPTQQKNTHSWDDKVVIPHLFQHQLS